MPNHPSREDSRAGDATLSVGGIQYAPFAPRTQLALVYKL
jgi:hypothetical protein